MDVLFLSGSAELGGAERSLLDMLASLRAARPAWRLALLTPGDGPLVHDARRLGVAADELPYGPALARLGEPAAGGGADLAHLIVRAARTAGPVAGYAKRLRHRLRAIAPDIIHTHGLKAHLFAAWLNPGTARVLWHLHDYIGRRRTSTVVLRRSVHRCAGVLANSQSVADDARRALGHGVSVAPLLNGIDLARYTPEGPHLDLDGGSPRPDARAATSGTLRVGLLATFGRWKGHTTFLDACARLSPDLRIHAYIIGAPLYTTDGSQYTLAELKAYAVSRGLADRVTFTGYVAQSERALRALDIVVHASTDPEPFGLVIAEAMACGRPVIVANAGGACEIVRPDVDAVTHTPGDAASLAARICELAGDPARRVRLAHAARAAAVQRFDRGRLAADLLPIYQQVMTAGAPA